MKPSSQTRSVRTNELPTVDLVVGTLGRRAELAHLLETIAAQRYPSVKVLLVDQNPPGELDGLVRSFEGRVEIAHISSEKRGINHARNVGLRECSSEVVGIPDDDCWFPEGLLGEVGSLFGITPELGGITVRLLDAQMRPSNGRWDSSPGPVRRSNVWGRAVGSGIFLRREAIEAIGALDETLGPGSGLWPAGDETDLVIRAIDAGFRVEYIPRLYVHHPDPRRDLIEGYPLDRWRAYGASMGHVMRKHGYPRRAIAYHCARPLVGSIVAALRGDRSLARIRVAMARGRLEGWHGRLQGVAGLKDCMDRSDAG